jgi:sulfide:quinone oxidoreductase
VTAKSSRTTGWSLRRACKSTGNKIPGLKETVTRNGVCSNYSYETVDSTWQNIRNFKGGTAIFTMPSGAVKCGGAPQKIMYLADETFRKNGVRNGSTVMFTSTLPNIFAVDRYRKTLEEVIKRKEIVCHFREELIEVRGEQHEAVFKQLDTGDVVTRKFDMLHVTPPMGPPSFLATSPLADKDGWVDVDKATLQHKRFRTYSRSEIVRTFRPQRPVLPFESRLPCWL